jgi:hypothetical protein
MTSFSFAWQDLTRIETALTAIDSELRSIYPLLESNAARCASAPIVACAIAELIVALSSSIERSHGALVRDVDSVQKATRAYQIAEELATQSSQNICRALPTLTGAVR